MKTVHGLSGGVDSSTWRLQTAEACQWALQRKLEPTYRACSVHGKKIIRMPSGWLSSWESILN